MIKEPEGKGFHGASMDVPAFPTSGLFHFPRELRLLCVFLGPALGLATSVRPLRQWMRERNKMLVKNKSKIPPNARGRLSFVSHLLTRHCKLDDWSHWVLGR